MAGTGRDAFWRRTRWTCTPAVLISASNTLSSGSVAGGSEPTTVGALSGVPLSWPVKWLVCDMEQISGSYHSEQIAGASALPSVAQLIVSTEITANHAKTCYTRRMIADKDRRIIEEIATKYHVKHVVLFGSSLSPDKESRDIRSEE